MKLARRSPGTTTSPQSGLAGHWWCGNGPTNTINSTYTHFGPPNIYSCYPSNTDEGSWGGSFAVISATSNHSQGVNVCFADGSVRFVKNSVALPTWWALGTRSGNEPISSDQY